MDKRLRDKFEKNTVTGTSLCPEHQKMFDDGYIALIEIDPSKSGQPNHYGNLMPENAHRTGVVVHLRRKVFEDIFDGSRAVDKDGKPLPMVFIDPEVTALLQKMTGDATDV